MTTQSTQPLLTHLPSILVLTPTQTPNPTPNPTPAPTLTPSAATATMLGNDFNMPTEAHLNGSQEEDEEPMEWYHIEVPPLLPGTSSQQAFRAENMML